MHRTMRDRLTLLLAAAALIGTGGITKAESTTIKYQLVQQTNPNAADRAGSAADRAAGQAGNATDRAAGQVDRALDHSAGQPGSQGGNQSQMALPQGITPKDYGDVRKDVRDTLGSVAKAALSRDNFGDLRDQLAKSDRDRLSTNDNKYPDELNRAIDQFNQAWQSKYQSSFSLDADTAYPDQFLAATAGEVTNPQQVSNWPVAPQGQKPSPETSNPTMNQGTGVAVATFTSQQGQPPLHVSLVREMGGWKIDIPDSVTVDQLKSNLTRQLTEVTNMQNQWPQDQAQAQRIVTGHILMALYNLGGQQGSQGGQSSQQPSTMGGQPGQPQPQPRSEQTTHTQSGHGGQHGTSTQPGQSSQQPSAMGSQPGQAQPQPRSEQTTHTQSGQSGQQGASTQPGQHPQGNANEQEDMEE